MIRCIRPVGVLALCLLVGCNSVGSTEDGSPTGLAAEVAQKAQDVAQEIGGPMGFGEEFMDGYLGHMAQHMGFHGPEYLADPDGDLILEATNDSTVACIFHVAYVRSEDGLHEQFEDVVVQPGETVHAALPCAEIVGLGSLSSVGAVAADSADGGSFDNQWCVPGFLNSDYLCGGTYACVLTPDTDDLDGDGDTEELIVLTSAMWSHMQADGMGPHMGYDDGHHGMMDGWHGPMMGWTDH